MEIMDHCSSDCTDHVITMLSQAQYQLSLKLRNCVGTSASAEVKSKCLMKKYIKMTCVAQYSFVKAAVQCVMKLLIHSQAS